MKKQGAFVFMLALALFVGISVCGYSQNQSVATAKEEIILTTYYPVPYGDYRNLRLWPSNTEETKECNDNVRGTLFYDQGTNEVKVCREVSFGTYRWQSLNLWGQSPQGDAIYPSKQDWNMGIGTENPAQKLDVSGQIHATEDICTDAGGGKCLSKLSAESGNGYGGGYTMSYSPVPGICLIPNPATGGCSCPGGPGSHGGYGFGGLLGLWGGATESFVCY